MVDGVGGESPDRNGDGRASPGADAPASDASPLDSTDGDSLEPADGDALGSTEGDEQSDAVDPVDAIDRAAGAGDETVPRSTGPEAWTAVEEQVRLSEEPWWEADGAPPPHPDARPWHDADAESPSTVRSGRSSGRSGRSSTLFGTETRRRELLLAVVGVVALVLVVLTATAWLATAVGGP